MGLQILDPYPYNFARRSHTDKPQVSPLKDYNEEIHIPERSYTEHLVS